MEWRGTTGGIPDGQPKGLKCVLQERGVNTNGMTARKLKLF